MTILPSRIIRYMRLIFPDPAHMAALGYPKLAYCPFLIDSKGKYPPEPNQYIRERSLAEWTPRLGQNGTQKGKLRILTKGSRKTVAARLGEFLKWCDKKSLDWREVEYTDDLLLDWQPDLLTGRSSSSGKQLRNSTVNGLIGEAIMFLTWAADRKHRPPFSLILNSSNIRKNRRGDRVYSGNTTAVETRMGNLPPAPPPPHLTLPSDSEIKQWLREIHILRGPVKRLMCETICRTGLRLAEVCQMLAADFPTKPTAGWPETWIADGAVPVKIHRGNKGPKVSAGSVEAVNPRWVKFPIDLADRITHYLGEGRTTLILRGIDRIKDKDARAARRKAKRTDRLWIGERYGQPVSEKMLQRVWSDVPSCPKRWHPHIGRELFSVIKIVDHMKDLVKTREMSRISGINDLGWLDGLMLNQIKIILSGELGHVSETTSGIYLKAAKQRLIDSFNHPALAWADACGDEDDTDD